MLWLVATNEGSFFFCACFFWRCKMMLLARSWCCRSQVHFEFCVCKAQWFWPLEFDFLVLLVTKKHNGLDRTCHVMWSCCVISIHVRASGNSSALPECFGLKWTPNNLWIDDLWSRNVTWKECTFWSVETCMRNNGPAAKKKHSYFRWQNTKLPNGLEFQKCPPMFTMPMLDLLLSFNLCSSTWRCTQCTVSVACLKANVFFCLCFVCFEFLHGM